MPSARPESETFPGFDIDNPESAEAAVAEVEQSSGRRGQNKGRIMVAFTPDGGLDLGKLKGENLQRLKEGIKATPLLAAEGVDIPSPSSTFSKETLSLIVNLQSGLETNLAAKTFKQVPKDIIASVFPYNQEEQKVLTDALQKIVAKYPFLNSIKYKEEFDYLGMSLGLFVQKTMVLKERLESMHYTPPAAPQQPVNGKAAEAGQ